MLPNVMGSIGASKHGLASVDLYDTPRDGHPIQAPRFWQMSIAAYCRLAASARLRRSFTADRRTLPDR
jgi:hypothetical protein